MWVLLLVLRIGDILLYVNLSLAHTYENYWAITFVSHFWLASGFKTAIISDLLNALGRSPSAIVALKTATSDSFTLSPGFVKKTQGNII